MSLSRFLALCLTGSTLILTCHAQEITINYEYDSNNKLTKITDGLGRVHNIEYDPLSRIKRLT